MHQLLTEMDELIEWFVETERQILDADPLTFDPDKLKELLRDHKVDVLQINVNFARWKIVLRYD